MQRVIPVILVLAISLSARAQVKPVYEKTTFIAQDGKLYIAKELPIYLWLSTSPDESAKKYRLQSEETAKYSNPFYLDTDGFNSVRSPSAVDPETKKSIYPLRDVVFEVYADGTSPVTKISYGNVQPLTMNGVIHVMGETEISFSATDKYSGVADIYYSLDSGDYKKFSNNIKFTQEKEYTLKYYAVDNVGNDEEVHVLKIAYDKTPPTTTRTIKLDEYQNILSARSLIELTANDNGVGLKRIKYKINDGKVYTYTTPLRAGNLSQGEHTITYFAIDKVGNTESEQTYTFYVDKTAPTIIEEVIGKSFFANGREFSSGKAQLKLTAFDNKAGVMDIMYSINGGEYIKYNKPVFLTQGSGNLVIKTYAVDHVNNKSTGQTANQKTDIPYIDLSGPSLSHSISGPEFKTRDTVFISDKTKLILKARDPEAGLNRIEYQIDGKEIIHYENSIQISEEGFHTISYVGYDNVENTSTASFTVKVDKTGPVIGYQFSTSELKTDTYPKHVQLFLYSTDNVVGLKNIAYGFGDSPKSIYAAPINNMALGDKTIKVLATDKLGNISEQEIVFTIVLE